MNDILLTFASLAITLVLITIFITKKSNNNIETKIYIRMLIINIVFCLTCITTFYIAKLNKDVTLIAIFQKTFMVELIFLTICMLIYNIYLLKIKENSKKIFSYTLIAFGLVISIAAYFAPLTVINTEELLDGYGASYNIVYTTTIVLFIIIVFTCIKRFIEEKKLIKNIPSVVLILLFIVGFLIREVFPSVMFECFFYSYVLLIMYFTIENPDVKMLEQISLAKDQAEKANAAKTDFLSSMSHEIRTPLNAIVGFSEAIKEEETLEAAKQDAKDIILASQNLLEIVNGILDISKIEANKMEIVNTEYDLVEECKLIAKLIKPRIGEKPIELEVNIAPDIPHTLYGDKSKVKEILSNLLTNAVKYTESGTISFNVSCINKNDECSLVFSVEDTGRGIKPEKIDHLFKKFERLEEDRNTTVEGAGLGLAITKSLVEMMDGKIIVQSVFGSGSKFTVYLKQKIIPEKRYHLNSDFAKEPLDLSGKRILIVDDNELNIKVAERLLKKYNLIIDTCSSGISCLEKIQDGEIYDLILMDDMMPKMSGTETLHLLKEIPSFKTRVVALTANAIEGMKEKYLSVGFDDYLSKPMENKEVDRILRKFLNKEYHPSEFAPLPDDFYEISETAILNINNLEEKTKK